MEVGRATCRVSISRRCAQSLGFHTTWIEAVAYTLLEDLSRAKKWTCLAPWLLKWSNVASYCRRQTFPFFAMCRFVRWHGQVLEFKVEPSHGETHVRRSARRSERKRRCRGCTATWLQPVTLLSRSDARSFAMLPDCPPSLRRTSTAQATSQRKHGSWCRWPRCSTMPPCCTLRQRADSRIAVCKALCRRVRLRLGQTDCGGFVTTSGASGCTFDLETWRDCPTPGFECNPDIAFLADGAFLILCI